VDERGREGGRESEFGEEGRREERRDVTRKRGGGRRKTDLEVSRSVLPHLPRHRNTGNDDQKEEEVSSRSKRTERERGKEELTPRCKYASGA